MPQTITLTLPDEVFQPVQRAVQTTQQSVETLLLTALMELSCYPSTCDGN